MKIISGSKSGNFNLNRRMTKNSNFRIDFLKFQSQIYMWEVKVGLNFLVGFGGTIGKYPGAKQSLDSDTNSL